MPAVSKPIQVGQYQGCLFHPDPLFSRLSEHFLWNIVEHFLQVRGRSRTWVATGSMFILQDLQGQHWEVTEDNISLLTWSMA